MNNIHFVFIVFMCLLCTGVHATPNCNAGYSAIIHSVGDTIVAPMAGGCDAGWRLQDIPDDIMPANGYSTGKDTPLCTGYWSGTTCNPHASSDCPSGQHGIYYNTVVMAPSLGRCEDGYVMRAMPDGMVMTNGFDSGQQIALGTITHTQGDCPDGYLDLAVNDDSFFKLNTSGACSGGYKYTTAQCKSEMPDSPMICGILCEDGLEYTDVGTCSALCAGEHKTLRTNTGLSYPLYATKSVTPSLNIKSGDTTCYINLISGTQTDAINIKYNNKIYHTVN